MKGLMRPVSIPDALLPPDTVRVTLGAPNDDDLINRRKIHPLEAWRGEASDGVPAIGVLLQLDEGDLEKLKEDDRIWLVFIGPTTYPFSFALVHDVPVQYVTEIEEPEVPDDLSTLPPVED